ncbi:MAG: peptidase MA family metallohydrolase [Dehalococcoidia bacterium]
MRLTARGLDTPIAGIPRGIHRGALLLALAIALGAAFALATPRSAHADTIEVTNQSEETADPTSLTFRARVNAPAGLAGARFTYKVLNPDGNVGGSGEVEVAPGSEVDLAFTLGTISNDRYIPVGSTFVYQWELEDTTGDTVTTEEREYLFLDGRYDWKSKTEGTSPPVTVYWYGNNEDRADNALEATTASLEKVGALLETTVPYPIKVMVWGSEAEGEMAARSRGRTFDATVTTGGQRVAPDLIFVFVPATDIVLHEVGHIVTHVAGDGPFTSLPSWIDEGTAVWAQQAPGGGYSGAVAIAVQGDRTLSLRSMQSPSNRPEEVNLFYGQSFSVVDYLINEYGREQFAELYRVHREGARIDDALMQVYGLNQDGVYNAWRESVGLEPLELTGPASGSTGPVAEATRAPLGIPTGVSGSASTPAAGSSTEAAEGSPTAEAAASASNDGGGAGAAIAVGLVSAVIAAALGAGGFALSRRGRRTAS